MNATLTNVPELIVVSDPTTARESHTDRCNRAEQLIGQRVRVSQMWESAYGSTQLDALRAHDRTGTVDRVDRGDTRLTVLVRFDNPGPDVPSTVWAYDVAPIDVTPDTDNVPAPEFPPGTIVTADNGAGSRVWVYVVVPLPDGTVYGVSLGQNLGYLTGELAWGTFEAPRALGRTLSNTGQEVREALTSFLRRAGHTLPEEGQSRGEETGQALERAAIEQEVSQRLTERFEAWKSSLVADAHEFANDNNLCGEFDRFMREHNLPERERDYDVTWTLTISGVTTVTASGRENASDIFEESPLEYVSEDMIREQLRYGSPDWTVDDSEPV